ncbi:MAG TPA: BsuPI-related putative proteinase inhibitor [Longimicrobiales bacterium]|nr:BsuPI-related putative proteinase inhibitor [Longimicrobiales bacterium]
MRVLWLVSALILAAGCGRGSRTVEVPAGAGSAPGLGSSLNVRVSGDSAHFELHITNTTSGPVTVSYMSAQRYDFEVTRGSGEVVWRHSADQLYAQVTGREVLQAGETKRYVATWIARGHTGDYVATARLTSDSHPVELRTVFRLPAD